MPPFQAPPCSATPPDMHIEDRIAYDLVGNFQFNKLPVLHKIIDPESTTIQLSLYEFSALLGWITSNKGDDEGVRIYFATYKKNGDPECDTAVGTKEGLLTLVFALTNMDNCKNYDIQEEKYGIINSANKFERVSRKTASAWVKEYQDNKWVRLTQELQKDYPGREETKSILHPYRKLQQLADEIVCFENNPKIEITGVTIHFGAYNNDTELEYNDENCQPKTADISKQLCVIFAFTDNRSDIWHLSEKKRRASANEPLSDNTPDPLAAPTVIKYDTGTPCPPDTNCLGSSLPIP